MFRPNREFQAGLNADETRRRRQNNSLSLRRKDRENKLQKKRQRILNRNNNNKSPPQSPSNNNNSNYGNNEEQVDLSRFVQGVYLNNAASQYECVRQFRMVLSKPNRPPIKQVIDSGCVPRFIQLCQDSHHPQLQYESLWTLLNIASGPAEAAAYIIRKNAHMCFMSLLKSSQYYEIKDQAMWALGNIAGDCMELKDLLLNNGLLSNVLLICQSQYDSKCNTNFNGNDDIETCPLFMFISMLSTTSWCLSNLCRGSPPPTLQHLELIIQCIIELMRHAINFNTKKGQIFTNSTGKFLNDKITNNIDEILSNLAWATSYLTGFENWSFDNGVDYIIKRLGESGVIEQFVNLMDYENKNVRHSCNRVIGNILTGTDENTAKCVELGVLKKYHTVLTQYCDLPLMHQQYASYDKPQAKQSMNRERKEICWSISNIAAGPIEQKLLILDNNLFPILCRYLAYATNDVQREALWAISNATCDANKQIINQLVNKFNVIECMTMYLTNHQNIKNKTLLVAIECIDNILQCGNDHVCKGDDNPYLVKFEEDGLLNYLEDLSVNDNLSEIIFEKVSEIVEKYWNGNDPTNDRLDYNLDQGPNNNTNNINQEMQNSYYKNNTNNNDNNNNNTPQSNNMSNGHFNFGASNFLNNNNGNNTNNQNNNNNDSNNTGFQF